MTRCNTRSRLLKTLLIVVICIGLLTYPSSPVYAAPGDLDDSFGGGDGMVITPVGVGSAQANAVAIQADHKIVVAGYATINGNGRDFALVRYKSDGSLDDTFGEGGVVTTHFGGGDDEANAVAIQVDGMILVAGYASMGATGNDFAVARYETDGDLDILFGVGGIMTTDFGGLDDRGLSMALQSNGKIVVAGHANPDVLGYDFALARYTSAGALDDTGDTAFDLDGKVTTPIGAGAGANDIAKAVAIQSDGKIVAAGSAVVNSPNSDFAVVRYLTSGALDTEFGGDGIVTTPVAGAGSYPDDSAAAVLVQPDGKIVAAGSANVSAASYNLDVAVVRYTAGGALDNSLTDGFGGDGIVITAIGSAQDEAYDLAYGVALQQNGKLVVAGVADMGSSANDFAVVRYTATGEPDTSFGGSGKVKTAMGTGATDDQARAVVIQPDGKIVVAGVSAGSFAVARYSGDPLPQAGLEIPTGPYSVTNGKVDVPVNLAFSLVDLGAVAFSLDYDTTCLGFSLADGDDAGTLPDAVSGIPPGFTASVDYDAGDTDGELDIALMDETTPIDPLPVGTVMTITFSALSACDPPNGGAVSVAMSFSQDPAPSFGTTGAEDVDGSATAATITVVYATPPSGINLSNSTVAENQASGTPIGTLSVEDPAPDEVYSFAVVAGEYDSASFTVSDGQLKTTGPFNYEGKLSYQVRIHATGSKGTSLYKVFDIGVTDVNEDPTAIALDNSTVAENAVAGEVVGNLTTTDEDGGETHTYTMVAGDATAFEVSGQQLVTNKPLDFEAAPNSFSLRIRTTDKGDLYFESDFLVQVTNVNEAPIAVNDIISPSLQVFVGTGSQIDVLANDDDPEGKSSLRVSAVGDPGSGATSHNGNVVFFVPPDKANGATSFTYTVSDEYPGDPLTDTGTVTVTFVANDARGDCNADGAVNAADFVATVLEWFDAPSGAAWWEVYAAGYAGSPQGCDSNADESPDIADLICTVRLYFDPNINCTTGTHAASLNQPVLSTRTSDTREGIVLTVNFAPGGSQAAAVAFEIRYDPARVRWLGTDDSALPDGIVSWVVDDAAQGRIQVALAGVTLPIVPLPTGDLVELRFAALGDATPAFSLANVSLGDMMGARLPVSLVDGKPATSRLLLPMALR